MARFLILHGLHGSTGDHWQRWLHDRLTQRGCAVAFPDLPEPDRPDLEAWLATLRDHLGRDPGDVTVVCHSLSCMLWLHHAASRPPAVDRVLLNAPPEPVAEAPSFFPPPLDAAALAAAAGSTRIVCSDDDPYAPSGAAGLYGAPLGVPVDLLPGQGHLNVDAGYGPWPAMEAWCLGQRDALAAAGAKNGVET